MFQTTVSYRRSSNFVVNVVKMFQYCAVFFFSETERKIVTLVGIFRGSSLRLVSTRDFCFLLCTAFLSQVIYRLFVYAFIYISSMYCFSKREIELQNNQIFNKTPCYSVLCTQVKWEWDSVPHTLSSYFY